MSNLFTATAVRTDADVTIDGNLTVTKTFTLDGYTINPSNAEIGQALIYDGYIYKPSTIASHIANGLPTINGGPGLSDGYTISLARATNTAGIIKFTQLFINNAGTPFDTAATVTFNTSYSTIPKVILTPANSNSAVSPGTFYLDDALTSTSSFTIKSGTLATSMKNVTLGMSTIPDNNTFPGPTMSWTIDSAASWISNYIQIRSSSGLPSIENVSTSNSIGGTVSTLAWSHTTFSASTLLICIATNLSNIITVTCDGYSPMGLNGSIGGAADGTTLYAYAFPDMTAGIHNIIVSLGTAFSNVYNPASAIALGIINSNGIDIAPRYSSSGMKIGNSTSVSGAGGGNGSNYLIVDAVAVTGIRILTADSGQTQRATISTSGTGYEYDYIYNVIE